METIIRFDMETYSGENVCFVEALLKAPEKHREPLKFQRIAIIVEGYKLSFFKREEPLYLSANAVEDIYKVAQSMGVYNYSQKEITNELTKASRSFDLKIPKPGLTVELMNFTDGTFYVFKDNGVTIAKYNIREDELKTYSEVKGDIFEKIVDFCRSI